MSVFSQRYCFLTLRRQAQEEHNQLQYRLYHRRAQNGSIVSSDASKLIPATRMAV